MKYTLEERLALVTLGFSPLELLGERFAEADEALTTLNESEELDEKSTSSERKKAAKAMAKKRKSSSFRKKEGKQAKKREGKRKDPKRSKAAKMGARHRT